jgi:hypothetical protein
MLVYLALFTGAVLSRKLVVLLPAFSSEPLNDQYRRLILQFRSWAVVVSALQTGLHA